MEYEFLDNHQVWVRPDYDGIRYSDGAAKEDKIFEGLKACTDRSVYSAEVEALIRDWPSEYHFSQKRHAVVKPLGIKPGDKVLELGCGCGAITRYLGDLGADVVSVEGTISRARTAAKRCEDMPNVRVFVDNFLDFSLNETFDWVLFIGVLEYAPVYGRDDKFGSYLSVARQHLKPEGAVAVAIENKIGLKYFNNCAEDHVGKEYFGVNDLYSGNTAETFSKKELGELLRDNGFASQSFWYMYPDYKLCEVAISDAAFKTDRLRKSELLLGLRSRDYRGVQAPQFSEAFAASSLEKAGLMEEFANSFLLVASQTPLPRSRKAPLAILSNATKRAPHFVCETSFHKRGDRIVVSKEPVTQGKVPPLALSFGDLTQDLSDDIYRDGESEGGRIARRILADARPRRFRGHFLPWARFLRAHAMVSAGTDETVLNVRIPGDFIDAIPFNAVAAEGELKLIDKEWVCSKNLPIGWVLFRGIREVLSSPAHGLPFGRGVSVRILGFVAADLGMSVPDGAVEQFLAAEREFQAVVKARLPAERLADVG